MALSPPRRAAAPVAEVLAGRVNGEVGELCRRSGGRPMIGAVRNRHWSPFLAFRSFSCEGAASPPQSALVCSEVWWALGPLGPRRKEHHSGCLSYRPVAEATPVHPAWDSDLVSLLVNLLIKPPLYSPSSVNRWSSDLVVQRITAQSPKFHRCGTT